MLGTQCFTPLDHLKASCSNSINENFQHMYMLKYNTTSYSSSDACGELFAECIGLPFLLALISPLSVQVFPSSFISQSAPSFRQASRTLRKIRIRHANLGPASTWPFLRQGLWLRSEHRRPFGLRGSQRLSYPSSGIRMSAVCLAPLRLYLPVQKTGALVSFAELVSMYLMKATAPLMSFGSQYPVNCRKEKANSYA
ncbi:hypothetical protein F5880DRAFT_31477 [Lentinula raphanica]|nr:hypothetical protein F5880DRAFT_31477 [Lentinula raphanica]